MATAVACTRSYFRSLQQIRDVIPPRLFVRDTRRGFAYLARDLALAAFAWTAGTQIDPFFRRQEVRACLLPVTSEIARWLAWCT